MQRWQIICSKLVKYTGHLDGLGNRLELPLSCWEFSKFSSRRIFRTCIGEGQGIFWEGCAENLVFFHETVKN
jgi:hypothetical protein